MYKLILKRIFDFSAALLFSVLLLPVFLIILTAMIFFVHRPFFFTQIRPGKNGKLFTLIKFRTMNNNRDNNGNLLPDFERMTWIGSILRKTSLDEIPQLLNVLKGDMSLVGPRPLLPEYLPLYSTLEARRHEVLPGITGWAQVKGRNAISWEKKFEYDVWYVDHISFLVDMHILLLTLLKIVKGGGINVSDRTTMEKLSSSRMPKSE